MATQTLTRKTCDRCQKIYSEVSSSSPAPSAVKPPPTLHLEFTLADEEEAKQPRVAVSFPDLCPKCHSRVGDLVAQIKLEKEGKEDDKSLDPGAKTPDKDKAKAEAAKAPEAKANN